MSENVEHLIVLMLENRSFDHMLGFLDHPTPTFAGLTGKESNLWAPGGPPAEVSPFAYRTVPDPGHDHVNVMRQLTGRPELSSELPVNCSGFAWDYSKVCRDKGLPPSRGAQIMRCQDPNNGSLLGTLALEYAVCDHWFSSVPGATWPNRNFAVAATSDGKVDIEFGPYGNDTIFETLETHGHEWRIYHDGIPQLWAFPSLWARIRRRWFKSREEFFKDIRTDKLPSFAFIEPTHFGKNSNSQHPGNNLESDRDFQAGEALIREVYTALIENPRVFDKSLLLITYDEHGGFYDHVPPPRDPSFRDGRTYEEDGYRFQFDLLGPRVPAVLVSPRIPCHTLVSKVLDHSSIVATARALFVPEAPSLTSRDHAANTFHDVVLEETREPSDLPTFSTSTSPLWTPQDEVLLARTSIEDLDTFQSSLLRLAEAVEKTLREEGRSGGDPSAFAPWRDARESVRPDLDTVGKADKYQESVVNLFRESS